MKLGYLSSPNIFTFKSTVGPTLNVWMTIIVNYSYSLKVVGIMLRLRDWFWTSLFFRLAYATPRSGGLPHTL